MDRINRLLQDTYQITRNPVVHFIVGNICEYCKGPCRGAASEEDVFIIDDIPRNYKPGKIETSIFRGFHEEQEEIEKSVALTLEEQKAVDEAVALTLKEQEVVDMQKSNKKKYRNMFGYG